MPKIYVLSVIFLLYVSGCCFNPNHNNLSARGSVYNNTTSQLVSNTSRDVKKFIDTTDKRIARNIYAGEEIKKELTDLEKNLIEQTTRQAVDINLISGTITSITDKYELQLKDLNLFYEEYKKNSIESYIQIEQTLTTIKTENDLLKINLADTSESLKSIIIENDNLKKDIANTNKSASMWRMFVWVIFGGIVSYVLIVTYVPSFFNTILKLVFPKKSS